MTCNYTGVFVPELKTYRAEVTGRARATESKPISQPPGMSPNKVDVVQCTPTGGLGPQQPIDVTGWPEGQITTEEFTWTATYEFTTPALQADEKVALLWALRGDADPADESQVAFGPSTINIYEL